MAYYITRVSHMTQAVNTMAAFTLDAEGATVQSPNVPKGVTHITQLIVSLSASTVAVGSAGAIVILRLTGTGLLQGQQDIVVGFIREDTTSTAGAKIGEAFPIDVDIPVTESNAIGLSASMIGVDPGTPELVVTLVLE